MPRSIPRRVFARAATGGRGWTSWDVPGAHGILAAAGTNLFEWLEIGATLFDGAEWRSLHARASIISFELRHGVELDRERYSQRCFAKVARTRKPVRGHHAGLCDLFVPVVVGGRLVCAIVIGPFFARRPTSTDIVDSWRKLAGRQSPASDPTFLDYVTTALGTLVLDDDLLPAFERYVVDLAQMMAGTGDVRALLLEMDALRPVIERARGVEQAWAAARSMVEERTSHAWSSPTSAFQIGRVGLSGVPTEVVVALTVDRRDPTDPVDAIIRRDALQRACVALARAAGHVIAGRAGEHGVTLLSSGRDARKVRRKLLSVLDKASTLAGQRFGLSVHAGLCTLPASAPLWERYESAMAAAETALSQRVALVRTAEARESLGQTLSALRRKLGNAAEPPETLPARFDRYLETVVLSTGHRLEPTRAHAEAGFERIADLLIGGGMLDAKGTTDVLHALDTGAGQASTVSELLGAYRRAVSDLVAAHRRPATGSRDGRIRRALVHIREHYAEPLSLPGVARVAGFAPAYFSVLFKKHQHVGFAKYVRTVRIARAKELLARTDLSHDRVSELCGFRSRHHFARVFKEVARTTPLRHRQRARVT